MNNTLLIDGLRDFIHNGSIVLLIIILGATIYAAIRPARFRSFFKEFSQRRYIIISGIFVSLLCGTIFVATQSPTHGPPQPGTAHSTVTPVEGEPDKDAPASVPQNTASVQPSNPTAGSTSPGGSGSSQPSAPASSSTRSSSPTTSQPAASDPVQNTLGQVTETTPPSAPQVQPQEDQCRKILVVCLP